MILIASYKAEVEKGPYLPNLTIWTFSGASLDVWRYRHFRGCGTYLRSDGPV